MRGFPLFLVLLLFWVSLSGLPQLTNPFLIGSGVVTCAGVTWVSRRWDLEIVDWGILDWAKSLPYALWLLGQVVIANWRVLKLVWDPALPIDPRMVEVPCELKTATGRVIYGNSITLTPGTVTVNLGEDRFLVHALTEEDAEGVRDGSMHARVAALEPSSGGPA